MSIPTYLKKISVMTRNLHRTSRNEILLANNRYINFSIRKTTDRSIYAYALDCISKNASTID